MRTTTADETRRRAEGAGQPVEVFEFVKASTLLVSGRWIVLAVGRREEE